MNHTNNEKQKARLEKVERILSHAASDGIRSQELFTIMGLKGRPDGYEYRKILGMAKDAGMHLVSNGRGSVWRL